MKLISDKQMGRRIIVEFTEEELGVIVAAVGGTSDIERREVAEKRGLPYIKNPRESYHLFTRLLSILTEDDE